MSFLRLVQLQNERGLTCLLISYSRPVFATVCALMIILSGAVCIPNLPVALYPTLTPPQVSRDHAITSAPTPTRLKRRSLFRWKRQSTALKACATFSSSSTNSGTSHYHVTFQTGYNLDIAAVDVQNRVASVQGRLPAAVNPTGITISKASSNFVFGAGFLHARRALLERVYFELPRCLRKGCASSAFPAWAM